MSGDETPLLLRREGAVLHAVLNRPARRNALSGALGEALDAMLATLREDRDTRILVLSGAGGHFCAGLDLNEVGADVPAEQKLASQLERNRSIGARFAALSALPQVVIASVRGSCFAGGLGFACAADITLADATARFAAPEVRRGLAPAQILPWLDRRIGRAAATRMVLESTTLDATQAARLGLVHDLLPDAAALEAAVQASIGAILQGAPGALAETKALLAALGPVSPPGYAAAGAEAFARCASGGEAEEGIAAFMARRPPAWVAPAGG